MTLQCSHIDKSFSTDIILSDISFHINDHEKAAIVGINGSGKSTLLKIITGELSADSGEVIISNSTTVGYLAQNQDYDSDCTILEEMRNARPEIVQLEAQIESLSQKMDTLEGDKLEQTIHQFDNARQRFEQLNGYAYQSEITGVLKGLGFSEAEFSKPVAALSGGEKTRAALAKMLLQAPDLIILDEPTNHLDIHAIAWLENYLANYQGSVLIVAHDRYFLDKIVTKVIELRQTHARMYQGNYSEYAKKRQAILDSMMKQYLNQQAEIRHQEEVIAKLKSFNREKSIKRAESREKMLNKIERLDKPTEEQTQMKLLFTPRMQSGNDVLSVEGLSKHFDNVSLFSDISFSLKRGEHVAIIGDNGTGKTTLLKIINELLSPDAGTITLGANVEIGYYDQEHQILHPDKTLFEEIQDAYPHMNNTQVRNTLAAFLFTEDDVFKQIKHLSGGERGRVSLAKLMLSDANLLILDEPTNHLDMDSKEILENAIRHFEGTVLYVSHDRYFINTTATRILHLTQKQVLNYGGNYDYYLEKRETVEQAYLHSESADVMSVTDDATSPTGKKSGASSADWQKQKQEQAKLRKQQKELERVEHEIETLEKENASLDEAIADPANASNSVKLQELAGKHEENDKKLEELMEHWEELSQHSS